MQIKKIVTNSRINLAELCRKNSQDEENQSGKMCVLLAVR